MTEDNNKTPPTQNQNCWT